LQRPAKIAQEERKGNTTAGQLTCRIGRKTTGARRRMRPMPSIEGNVPTALEGRKEKGKGTPSRCAAQGKKGRGRDSYPSGEE